MATANGTVAKIAPSPAMPVVTPAIVANSSTRNQLAQNRSVAMKITPLPSPITARERNAARYPPLSVNPTAPTLSTIAPPAPTYRAPYRSAMMPVGI